MRGRDHNELVGDAEQRGDLGTHSRHDREAGEAHVEPDEQDAGFAILNQQQDRIWIVVYALARLLAQVVEVAVKVEDASGRDLSSC